MPDEETLQGDEEKQEPPEGDEPKPPEVPPELQGIIEKYGGDPVKMAEAYQHLQGDHTKRSTSDKRLRQQLEEAGYTVSDDGDIYQPKPPEEEPPPDDKTPTVDDYLDPRTGKELEELRGQNKEMVTAFGVVAQRLIENDRSSLLSKVPEAAREAAAKSYDAKMKSLPAAQKLDPGMQKLTQNSVLGELFEAGLLTGGGTKPPPDVTALSGSSERPGSATGETRSFRLSADEKKAYLGLGGKEGTGMTEEEYGRELAKMRGEA